MFWLQSYGFRILICGEGTEPIGKYMSSSLLICAETLAERRPPCHPLAGGTCFVTLLHSPRLCSGSILRVIASRDGFGLVPRCVTEWGRRETRNHEAIGQERPRRIRVPCVIDSAGTNLLWELRSSVEELPESDKLFRMLAHLQSTRVQAKKSE